ncbi:twin-arginine translocase subunit TatC [Halorubrum trueperi]|uniref:Sec-independent protein translocase protein TatC n=1 Tax=Halorubrum trueperi TaxID=2004704 RepID=A0ABD5UHM6_9EURY
MDDSDRSRDEPLAPADDSVDDGTVDSDDIAADDAAGDSADAENSAGDDDCSRNVQADADSEANADFEADADSGAGGSDADEHGKSGSKGDDGGDEDDSTESSATWYTESHIESEVDTDDGESDKSDGADESEDGEDGDGDDDDGQTEADDGEDGQGDADGEADDGESDEADEDDDADKPVAEGDADIGDDEPFAGVDGPETDEEMPLADHIEEMMRRLAVVFVFGGLATLVVVTESTELINYFWSYHIPAPMENRPRLYGPLELPLTRLKVAGLAGVVVGLPAFVYQTYRFMKPGLYANERRYYLAAVPTSLVLGGIGIAFAHFLVLPAIFSYFTTYTSDAATIAFGLAETFNLIVIMLAFMAIVFQIPLFIMLAIMMNIVTRQWLEAKRLLFWGGFLGIAFLFSPDPTGMAPIIVTLTMIVLYEGTLAILRWTGN